MPKRTSVASNLPSEPFSLIHKATQRALYFEVRRALQNRSDENHNDVAEIAAAMSMRPTDVVLAPESSAALRCHEIAEALPTKASLIDSVSISVRRLCAAPADAVALVVGTQLEKPADWRNAIALAGRCKLPLLILMHTKPGPKRPDLRTIYAEYGVPVITVDANDAIAVYRVMTEAAHNSRVGRGTTLIEAAFIPGKTHGVASPAPLACLEGYMRRHGAWFHADEKP